MLGVFISVYVLVNMSVRKTPFPGTDIPQVATHSQMNSFVLFCLLLFLCYFFESSETGHPFQQDYEAATSVENQFNFCSQQKRQHITENKCDSQILC